MNEQKTGHVYVAQKNMRPFAGTIKVGGADIPAKIPENPKLVKPGSEITFEQMHFGARVRRDGEKKFEPVPVGRVDDQWFLASARHFKKKPPH